jgi:hypothetical protein
MGSKRNRDSFDRDKRIPRSEETGDSAFDGIGTDRTTRKTSSSALIEQVILMERREEK